MAPKIVRSAAYQFASRVDRAFVEAVITPTAWTRRRDPAESLPPERRVFLLGGVQAFYGQEEFLNSDGGFFSRPEPISPKERRVRRLKGGGEVVDLTWDSGFTPLWEPSVVAVRLEQLFESGELSVSRREDLDEMLREIEDPQGRLSQLSERYLAVSRNQRAHARWYRHGDKPRPTIIAIHGHMGGFMPMEERLWPIAKLYNGGMDVVLPTLPLHGKRLDPRRGLRPPDFPASDPRRTIEGFRHLVHDTTGLTDYLLDGRATSVGLAGMSLGGLATALLGTVDPRYRFAMMLVPLACIADFAHDNGRLVGRPEQQNDQAVALRSAQHVVSPLARPPQIDSANVIVVNGRADLVTGNRHADRLASHFGAHRESFEGGHILQFGRAKAFAPMWQMLTRENLWNGA